MNRGAGFEGRGSETTAYFFGLSRPQYRLRVGEVRVCYDVTEQTVEILAIAPKLGAAEWLAKFGEAE